MWTSRRCSEISPPPDVVADANVLLAAVIGGRARLVLTDPAGPRCVAAVAVRDEVLRYLPQLAAKRRLDLPLLLAAAAALPVAWQAETAYKARENEARKLMAGRDPDDWPTVALALATGFPIWSQDRDFEVTGLPIWTTGALLDALKPTTS